MEMLYHTLCSAPFPVSLSVFPKLREQFGIATLRAPGNPSSSRPFAAKLLQSGVAAETWLLVYQVDESSFEVQVVSSFPQDSQFRNTDVVDEFVCLADDTADMLGGVLAA